MDWNNAVWLYCERGTSTVLLAEPVNAAASVLAVISGLAGLWIYRKLPQTQKSADHRWLIVLTFLVGLGSLSFHLYANQWSELAHLLPLVLFFWVYMAFALNRFLDMSPGATSLTVGLMVLLSAAGLTMTCTFLDQGLQPPWSTSAGGGGATSCLNGSLGYSPFVLALLFLAFWLRARGHKAARSVMLASLLFLVSVVFHAIDHLACKELTLQGRAIGTHFIWHIVNALVLFILLRSSMRHQSSPLVQEIIPPDPRDK